jgi:prepilin-type N-terminal cleavage/methylation domain-containing protein
MARMHLRFSRPGHSPAFTLLELAIVIVIIGLIVGGITLGFSLKKQAALQSTIKDIDFYLTATKRFRDKYYYLPGDFPTATSVWGSAGGNCGTAGTGTQTANGNGNGQIDACCEVFRFWQQLSSEGLITGRYTGVSNSATALWAITGTNVPQLAYNNAGLVPFYLGAQSGGTNSMSIKNCAGSGNISQSVNSFSGTFGNLFVAGASTGSSALSTSGRAYTPAEAQMIDAKMDDGLPGMGKVMAPPAPDDSCATTSSASTAAYAVTSASPLCYLYVQFNF